MDIGFTSHHQLIDNPPPPPTSQINPTTALSTSKLPNTITNQRNKAKQLIGSQTIDQSQTDGNINSFIKIKKPQRVPVAKALLKFK